MAIGKRELDQRTSQRPLWGQLRAHRNFSNETPFTQSLPFTSNAHSDTYTHTPSFKLVVLPFILNTPHSSSVGTLLLF